MIERLDVALAARIRRLTAVAREKFLEQADGLRGLVLLGGELAGEEEKILPFRTSDVSVGRLLVDADDFFGTAGLGLVEFGEPDRGIGREIAMLAAAEGAKV